MFCIPFLAGFVFFRLELEWLQLRRDLAFESEETFALHCCASDLAHQISLRVACPGQQEILWDALTWVLLCVAAVCLSLGIFHLLDREEGKVSWRSKPKFPQWAWSGPPAYPAVCSRRTTSTELPFCKRRSWAGFIASATVTLFLPKNWDNLGGGAEKLHVCWIALVPYIKSNHLFVPWNILVRAREVFWEASVAKPSHHPESLIFLPSIKRLWVWCEIKACSGSKMNLKGWKGFQYQWSHG